MAVVSLMKLSSDECQWIVLMISQHCFRWWLDAVRQQAINWANVDPDWCRHMASLGRSKLKQHMMRGGERKLCSFFSLFRSIFHRHGLFGQGLITHQFLGSWTWDPWSPWKCSGAYVRTHYTVKYLKICYLSCGEALQNLLWTLENLHGGEGCGPWQECLPRALLVSISCYDTPLQN